MEDAILIKVFGKLIEALFLSSALKRHCTWYSDTFDIIKLDTGELCMYLHGSSFEVPNELAKFNKMLIKLICNIFFFRIRVIIPDNLGWILYAF